MSKALKCDRCGVCFDPYAVKSDITSIRETMFQDANQYKNREYGYFEEEMNFCPECTKLFRKFLHGTQLVEKQLLDTLQEDYDAEINKKQEGPEDEGKRTLNRSVFDDLDRYVYDSLFGNHREHRERTKRLLDEWRRASSVRPGETAEWEGGTKEEGLR